MSDVMTDPASAEFVETAGTPDPNDSTRAPDPTDAPLADAEADGQGPSAGSDARTRDERGRFAKAEADAPTTSSTSAADPALSPEGGPETQAEAAAPVDAPAPATTPFTATVKGQTYAIPGAALDASGQLVVAPDAVEHFHAFVGKAIKYDAERSEIKQARATLEQQRTVNDARYGEIGKRFAALMQMRQAGDAESFATWAQAFWDDLPVLQRQAQLDARAAELDLRAKSFEPDPEVTLAETERAAEQTVVQVIGEYRQAPWAKALSAEDWQAAYRSVEQHPEAYFVMTDQGLHFREGLFQAQVQQIAAVRGTATAAATKAAEAARFNAARQPGATKAPPVVKPPGSTAAPTPKKITNWAEWNKANGL